MEASQIVGTDEVSETPGAAKVGARIVIEAAEAGDDPDRDNAPYGAALPSPIVDSIEERDSLGPEQAAPHRAAVLRSWTPDSDPELEKLLRDTPEPDTPPVYSPTPIPERPLTPGAVRIPVKASNEPAENMEAVFDKFQAVV